MSTYGLVPTSVVHPRAALADDVLLGDGCLVLENAVVSGGVLLASHVQLHNDVTIGPGSVLHEFVTVQQGASVSCSATLHPEVMVGRNAIILPGRRVGARTVIGAGAVVTKHQLTDQDWFRVPAP
jgi:acetyltransferase-like isoleucine patch superfamily enzyme